MLASRLTELNLFASLRCGEVANSVRRLRKRSPKACLHIHDLLPVLPARAALIHTAAGSATGSVLSASVAHRARMKAASSPGNMSKRRILKELKELNQDPPENLSAGPKGDDIHEWSAVVVGPAGARAIRNIAAPFVHQQLRSRGYADPHAAINATRCFSADSPYANGIFMFDISFPTDYPFKPPRVRPQHAGKHLLLARLPSSSVDQAALGTQRPHVICTEVC